MIRNAFVVGIASAFASITPAFAIVDREGDFPGARPSIEMPTDTSRLQAMQCAHGDGDLAISACDWVIASGRWEEKDLAWAYWDRGIQEYLAKQDDKALEDFTHRIKLRPDDASAFLARGNVYRVTGKLQLALDDLNVAVKLKPDDARNYVNRGLVESMLKQPPSAMADFNKAVALDPQNTLARAMRGAEYYVVGNYASAMDDLNTGVALGDKSPITFTIRGDTYRRLEQFERAKQDCDYALTVDPEYTLALFGRGLALLHLRRYAQAVTDFDQVIRVDAENSSEQSAAYNNRCFIRAVWGREYDLALADCGKAIALRAHVNPFVSRAFVYLRQERLPEAISDCDQALKFDPKSADALFLRGLAKRKSNDIPGGDADLGAAKALDPKIAETYAGYGVTP